ncbi:MAG: hypothetical protein MJ250_07925 [Alphaproteobacteria bacterium]|nr:hypothetical protein [Alphaproteobacteria bacterium]
MSASSKIRPDWADESRTIFKMKQRMNFVGIWTASALNNPSLLCINAGSLAKTKISDYFKLNYSSSIKTDFSENSLSISYKSSENTSLTIDEIQEEGCYWEKIMLSSKENNKIIYRVFSRYSVPLSKFEN